MLYLTIYQMSFQHFVCCAIIMRNCKPVWSTKLNLRWYLLFESQLKSPSLVLIRNRDSCLLRKRPNNICGFLRATSRCFVIHFKPWSSQIAASHLGGKRRGGGGGGWRCSQALELKTLKHSRMSKTGKFIVFCIMFVLDPLDDKILKNVSKLELN